MLPTFGLFGHCLHEPKTDSLLFISCKKNCLCFFFCVCVCVVQQHQLQLVSLQQHKKQLEKHKKELEDMSMWPLFPKTVYKPGNVWSAPPSAPAFQPTTAPLTSTSAPINLAQHKKQAAGAKKIEKASGGPVSQPIQQHLMQVGLVDCC